MRLVPIAERLRNEGLKRVQGVLELVSLKAPPQLPAYFVVPDSESAAPNRMDGGAISQKTEVRFGVVIMLAAASANQDRLSDELQLREDEVIRAIVGWTHPDADMACDYVGAGLLNASANTLSWIVRFRTGRLIRKVAT